MEKYKIIIKYKNSKLKIIPPTWNDEFEIADGCYFISAIQDYNKRIIKKHETLTITPPIYVSINRINIRLVFKVKDGYKLELKTPE